VGADLALHGPAALPVHPDFEHALVVLEGAVEVDGVVVEPGHLGYLGLGRDELALTPLAGSRVILLGGEPFPTPILMWWNYVARTRDEIDQAHASWQADDGRFGTVASSLSRIPSRRPFWQEGPS